ncbi:hypothetical protein [Amycolatopsis sp. CA-128772]|uniref:hypothetical protein n=1 Tax=Amycolatopsis sp. CA-128772 TaxID=2073159 RepID=UPI0011B0D5CA|nr:hypothetical protein [Amycolatopsis sp. CA-128772]
MLVVALRLGWLSWLVADGGPVRKTLEGLSWVAALVAVGFSLFDLRRQRPEPVVSRSVHVGRALHLDGDRLPKVADVPLLALRVKRAVGTSDGQALPRYVPRDRDEDLEWAIACGGLVLLHGRAAAGKSRAAAEAVRRLRPGHDLLVPVDGPALRQIAESGLTDTVIWLDDLERFLVSGGLDVELLQRLAPSVCAVATIRDHELAAFRAEGAINRAAADLIASIPPSHLIAIDQRLTDTEQERAKTAQAGDPRIDRALAASEGFAEYLAAGTPMLERWSVGDDPLFYVGQALISAAVDCRRAGYAEAVPATTLAQLYRDYLPALWCERPDLPSIAEGLDWAARPVLGASSCLQPRADGTYLASDYLVDRTQDGGSPLGGSPVPDRTWDALFSLSSDRGVTAIGTAAYDAGRFDVAERCFRRASEAGDEAAVRLVAFPISKLGRYQEVVDIFWNGARSGHQGIMLGASVALSLAGRFDDLSDLARRAITDGDVEATLATVVTLADVDRSADLYHLGLFAIVNGEQGTITAVTWAAGEKLDSEQLNGLAHHAIETREASVVFATYHGLRNSANVDKEAVDAALLPWFAGQEDSGEISDLP